MEKEKINSIYKWNLYLYVPTIFLLSALHHFLYNLLPCGFVGVFAPINESLKEHTKIVFYPVILWWLITFVAFRKAKAIKWSRWFTSASIAGILSVALLVSSFSVIFYGFEVESESFLIHMIIELLSLTIGGLVGHHYYKRATSNKWVELTIMLLALCLSILMVIFTFVSIDVPIFISP